MNAFGRTPDGTRRGPIAWMAHNAIAANLLMFILLGGGIYTAWTMQKEVDPDFALDIVEVVVNYPGAAPGEVEQGIVLPIEEAIRGVPGIREITSRAWEGRGFVSLELVAGIDRIKAFQDIDQAITQIRTFPDDAEEPEVRLQERVRDVMEIALYGDADVWTMRQLAERVRDQLLTQPAISMVEIGGALDYITHVEISSARLREYGLTLGEVANLIEQSSRDVPAGSIDTSGGQILLRVDERKQWADQLGEIVIRSAQTGAPVTLADIAEIRDGFEEVGFQSQFNRRPSIDLEIFRIGDQSPLDVAAAVEVVLADLDQTLPEGISWRIDGNAAKDFEDRMDLLLENGAMAIVIIVLILSLFLEYRLAFWIMMGMTIAFVGSITVMPWLGVSINMVSMFGFLVALGIVVDDAIVVGENVYEYREQGMSGMDAAIQGAKEMAWPVTFSILTNVVAFLPVMFLPGTMGNYWWPLPVVVVAVLLFSLAEALFILPAHLAHVKDRTRNRFTDALHRRQRAFAKGVSHWIDTRYKPFLSMCLRHRLISLTAATTLLAVTGGYALSDHMGMVLMPELAADEIEAGVRLPTGTTRDQAAAIAVEVTEATMRMFDEHDLYRAAEGVKTNVRGGSSFVDVEIVMKPPDERSMSAREVIQLWRDQIGDIDGVDQITFEAERGPGSWRKDIEIDLSHANVDLLTRASEELVLRLEAYAAADGVNTNYQPGKSQLSFTLLPEGRALGLTPNEVGRQVRDAFFGAVALRFLRGTNEVEVRVKLPEEEREDLRYLENFVVRAPDGTEVPLLDVVSVSQDTAFRNIDRRDGRRVITVSTDVVPQSATGRLLAAIRTDVLPQLRADFPGLTWTFEGNEAEMRESTASLWGGFGLALFAIYALLAIAFGSYTQPLIVMTSIPFGVVGAILGHMILGYDLSLVSMMGVVAVSGVVVNGALIMVHYANGKREELGAFDAVLEAGTRRFRPIVLTTLTTFGGVAPIIMETSLQAYHLVPMAISLGFGILFSTSIMLVVVPCLYMALDDVQRWMGARSRRGGAGGVGTDPARQA